MRILKALVNIALSIIVAFGLLLLLPKAFGINLISCCLAQWSLHAYWRVGFYKHKRFGA